MRLSIKNNNIELVSDTLDTNSRPDFNFTGYFETTEPLKNIQATVSFNNHSVSIGLRKTDSALFTGKIDDETFRVLVEINAETNYTYSYRVIVFIPLCEVIK